MSRTPPITDIEKELQNLSDRIRRENKVKACLFTLIVFSKEDARGEYIQKISQSIIHNYPCRLIFLKLLNRDSLNNVKIDVTQHTTEELESMIVCDQISILATKEYLHLIPYLIAPHIVPDLPVYLLWGDDPISSEDVLNKLEPWTTRIIFDPESAENLRDLSILLLQKMAKEKTEVIDLSWAAISSWREALYQVFQTKETLEDLKCASDIIIHYNNVASAYCLKRMAGALYLQGWIAGQLKWEPSAKENEIIYTHLYGKTNVLLQKKQDNTYTPGSVLSLEIRTPKANYFFQRKQDPDKILVHISSKQACFLPIVIPHTEMTKGLNFLRELFYKKGGEGYQNTLKILSTIKITTYEKS
jgi:glucose-6-phosphate dehydrogenase assembly protein OpcA